MSEIVTAYPTSEVREKTIYNIVTALSDYIKTIPGVVDFFDSVSIFGSADTPYSQTGIKFTKGEAYVRIVGTKTAYTAILQNTSTTTGGNTSGETSAMTTTDIPVRYVTGIKGTTALWIDDYGKDVCMVFNKFEDKYFIANSAASSDISCFYTDTGSNVRKLSAPFNGSNIGNGRDYIAQPYYHMGINTGDIYTFDGGNSIIPFGIFNLGNPKFVKLFGNFALRII